MEPEPGSESQETKIATFEDSRCSFVNTSTGDIIPQICGLNGSTVTQLSEVPEDRPLDEPRILLSFAGALILPRNI